MSMRRKRYSPDDPREWLNRAVSNLARAESPARGSPIYLEDFCFDAQQAAEKAIKALFIQRGAAFPYSHDIGRLLTLLERAGEKVPVSVRRSEWLTRFAVEARYPGLSGPVTSAEHQRAVRAARAVVRWATGVIAPIAPRKKRATKRRK